MSGKIEIIKFAKFWNVNDITFNRLWRIESGANLLAIYEKAELYYNGELTDFRSFEAGDSNHYQYYWTVEH